MSASISFVVPGKPVSQGSMQARKRGKFASVQPSNKDELYEFRSRVAQAAAREMTECPLTRGPVVVHAAFVFVRPQNHFGTGRNAGVLKASAPQRHATTPDVDKCLRALLDAMTGIVFADDKQVVEAYVGKHYAADDQGAHTGVTVKFLDAVDVPLPTEMEAQVG